MNKQTKQSGFTHLAIIIILALALLGGLGYVYWQNIMQPKSTSTKTNTITKTTDTTKGWKTYSNYGVSFKYPQSWYVDIQDPSTYQAYIFIRNQNPENIPSNSSGPLSGSISMRISAYLNGCTYGSVNNPQYVSGSTDLQSFIKQSSGLNSETNLKQSTKTISGLQAISLSTTSGNTTPWTVKSSKGIYEITYMISGEGVSESERDSQLNPILATVSF